MRHLAWLALPLSVIACAEAQKPPAQVVEPLPPVPSAAPSAGPASDMPGSDGKTVQEPITPPSEAFQPISGTLAGKPWELKGAGTLGPIKDGSVQIALANYPIDCGAREQGPDDRVITLVIPWKAKTRLDLGKLAPKESSATMIDEKKKKPVGIKGWKPKGTVDVLSASSRAKTSGRIKIELTSGKEDKISAEIPVKVCYAD